MNFFLAVMYAWLADNNISYALYGADGSRLDSRYASKLPRFVCKKNKIPS